MIRTLGTIVEEPLWKKYVQFIHGSSTDEGTTAQIAERVKGNKTLVILDSLHTSDHVFAELMAYGPLVMPGSYLIVEDTNIDGVPVMPGYGPGPMTAVTKFLETIHAGCQPRGLHPDLPARGLAPKTTRLGVAYSSILTLLGPNRKSATLRPPANLY